MPITEDTPAALQDLIRNAKSFQPDTVRDEYNDNKKLWRLYLDLYELDEAKLQALIQKHEDEDASKLEMRQALASAYNLVPTIIDMISGYIFSEQPSFDVGTDPELEKFLKDCDGAGTSYTDFVRKTVLPMALVLGWVDVLIENPSVAAGDMVTQADVEEAGMTPHAIPVLPMQRLNWSCKPNGAYQWFAFTDSGADDPDPFSTNAKAPVAYVRYAEARSGVAATSYWIRSWKEMVRGEGSDKATTSAEWTHAANFAPTKRVPTATLYYRKSNDPERRHFGLSKIAMIAVLTKQIIQILSWTTEDMLANLAILALPSKGGQAAKTPDGEDAIKKLSVFSKLWFDRESKHAPFMLQGEVSHMEIKLKFVELHLREILRLANLLAAQGNSGTLPAGSGGGSAGGKATSGRQAEIERTELFRELTDMATGLDAMTLEILALVKSWTSTSDKSVSDITAGQGAKAKVKVNFHKGPYTLDPLGAVIADTQAAIELFRTFSGTAVEAALKQAARALIHDGGETLSNAMEEISKRTGEVVDQQNENDALMQEATVTAAQAQAEAAQTNSIE